jgi:uncharacterized membrane protein
MSNKNEIPILIGALLVTLGIVGGGGWFLFKPCVILEYIMDKIELHRKSEDWVKVSLITTVVSVIIGITGFTIQITNLTRIYEQRQTTVEVKLLSIEKAIEELKEK